MKCKIKNSSFNLSISILLFTLAFFSVSPTTEVSAQESQPMEAPIFVDGQPIRTRYMMREGHLLVPAVFLKHTGAYVDWNDEYSSVVFRGKNQMFALPIGQRYLDQFDPATSLWKRTDLSTSSINFGGVPFVPLVDVVQKLGMTVRYDGRTARTYITSNIPVSANSVRKASTRQKLVALTFDDGPEDYYTPMILDILKEKGAPATFFVVGVQIKLFPGVMEAIVAGGHGIGNHTSNHPNLRDQWTATVRNEIQSTQGEMARVVGRRPDLFRPPFGSIAKADVRLLNELGMKNMLWSVDTLDWSGLSAEEIMDIVHRDISPGGIILQHNFQSNARILDGTVEALPRIIDELRSQGYQFVTLQTLMERERAERVHGLR